MPVQRRWRGEGKSLLHSDLIKQKCQLKAKCIVLSQPLYINSLHPLFKVLLDFRAVLTLKTCHTYQNTHYIPAYRQEFRWPGLKLSKWTHNQKYFSLFWLLQVLLLFQCCMVFLSHALTIKKFSTEVTPCQNCPKIHTLTCFHISSNSFSQLVRIQRSTYPRNRIHALH